MARAIIDPKGVGGVSSRYEIVSGDLTEKLLLNDRDDAQTVAAYLAEFTQDRWDVVEYKTSHETIAAFEPPPPDRIVLNPQRKRRL